MQIAFNNIPDRLLRPVIQVADIRKARVASRKERAELGLGANDIIMQSPLGTTDYISREMLQRNFRYSDGKKIMLTALKSTTPIVVSRSAQISAYTLPVRGDISVVLPNSKVINRDGTKSLHLIVYLDQQGEIDRTKVYAVNQEFFKKMFKSVPGYTIPKNVAHKKSRITERKTIKRAAEQQSPIKQHQVHIEEQVKQTKTLDRPKVLEDKSKQLTAMAQIMSMDKTVGYILSDIRGNQRKLDLKQVAYLAKQKRIVNIGYSEPSDRKPYIFGIGIRLTDLPKIPL